MNTPADFPYLSEYLPILIALWHLAGAKIRPALVWPETPAWPACLPLALDFLVDFGGIAILEDFSCGNLKISYIILIGLLRL